MLFRPYRDSGLDTPRENRAGLLDHQLSGARNFKRKSKEVRWSSRADALPARIETTVSIRPAKTVRGYSTTS